MSGSYTCWRCGETLPDLLLPLPRQEECPHCRAQLHVCRMCVFFDAVAPQQCREPVADNVSDKQRANFCGYFQINPQAFTRATDQNADARRELDTLFGGESSEVASETGSGGDASREALEQFFKK